MLIKNIRRSIRDFYLKKIYKKNNILIQKNTNFRKTIFGGNNTIGKNVDIFKSEVGIGTYIGNNSRLPKCKIGNFSSIGMNVCAIIGNHPIHYVSTHPFAYSNIKNDVALNFKNHIPYSISASTENGYNIEIGHDVWIGDNVSILNGVTIRNGAVIAAGAVVVKDVPPFSIVGGVPAKIIKYRFEPSQVEFLMNLQWWNKDLKWIENNVHLFSDIKKFTRNIKK